MRSIFIILITLCTFGTASSGAKSSNEVGENICAVFEEAVQVSPSPAARDRYVRENLSARAGSEALLPAYEVIYHVSKDDRYEVFQHSVKEITGANWNCPAFKLLME